MLASSPMELTPKVFREVQFREKMRGGYHPEDVDEFLEQAAVALEALLEELREVRERSRRAEEAAAEAATTGDALRRMLVIAQRTADQAISEAREQADHMVVEARERAEAILADGEERGRHAFEGALLEGRANKERADEALRQAEKQVEALRGWVEIHKAHLVAALSDAKALVESAGLLSDPPEISAQSTVAVGEVVGGQRGDISGDGTDQGGFGFGVGPAQVGFIPGAPDLAGQGLADAGRAGPVVAEQRQWGTPDLDDADTGQGRQPAPVQSGVLPGSNGLIAQDNGGDVAKSQEVVKRPVEEDDDNTIAFNERALDSFFSDRDLGDERNTGRFRRHP